MHWKKAGIALLFFGPAIAAFSAATPRIACATEPATLAIAGPMAGTSFSVGLQYKVGVTAALRTLPDGRLLGREIAIRTYDDGCRAEIAEKAAMDAILESPVVVIGHSCSMATLAAEPIYARHGVLQITPASTNPKVTEMGVSTLFRMIGRDDVQGELAAERIATRHTGKRIGIFHFPGAYSTGLANTAVAALKSRGIIPAKIVIGKASVPSYAEEIQELIDAKAEIVYVIGGGLDSGVFVRQSNQMDAPFRMIGADALVSKVFTEAAGTAAEGIAFTFPPEAAELPSSHSAIDDIRAMGLEPVGYTLLAYAATQTWIEGVRRAGTFDAAAVAAAIRSAPLETILGTITFDAKGDIQTDFPAFAWYAWKGGKRVPVD